VALVAQRIDARHIQHPGILRPMRIVAAHASFSLDGRMFVHKGSAHLRVAFRADQIRIVSRSEVAFFKRAVHIVAVAALDETFVHLVMKRHIEGGLRIRVALEAERRLRRLKQLLLVLALVNAVASRAADPGLGVRRALEVGVRARVAGEAGRVYLLGRALAGIEYLGGIAGVFDVRFARTVAVLARYAIVPVHENHLAVRIR